MTDKAKNGMRNALRRIIPSSILANRRLIVWIIVSDVLDATALSALLWFFLEIAGGWWKLFPLILTMVGLRRIYLPLWRLVKGSITGRSPDEKIVEKFLRVFGAYGYPAPWSTDELEKYLERTMEDASLPESLRLQAAGLHRELKLVEDFRDHGDNLIKCESANEAFRRFKESSAKDRHVRNFHEEEAWL
jgi:hypothetical protein